MKKIFVLTGEPSGDKLASKVISKLENSNPNIEYLGFIKNVVVLVVVVPKGFPSTLKVIKVLLIV